MARTKRRTSSRITTGKKRRKVSITEVEEERPIIGKNWYFQQTPNAQVYYAKIAFGIISGMIVGLFYVVEIVAQNWFLFPLGGIIVIGLVARRFLNIDKETINDLKLYAWTGTISLIVAFIVTSALVYMIFNPPTVVF